MGHIKYQVIDDDVKNLLNYSTWTAGQSSAVGFGGNGDISENLLIDGIDPTRNTGYYSTVTPPIGGYAIYIITGLVPRVYIAQNGGELIDYLHRIDNLFTGTTVNDALQYAQNKTNLYIKEA